MFVAFVIFFLGLLHQSESAPADCQQLLRPFGHIVPQNVEGTWVLVAGGLNSTSALESFRLRDSAITNFVAINDTSLVISRYNGFNESCQYVENVITLEGSGFRFWQFNLTMILLHTTCPDCLLLLFEEDDKSPVRVYFFSKRREVEEAEMEEFKAQAGCLGMPHVAFMDPTKKLCETNPRSNATTTQEDNAQDGKQTA